MGWFFRSAEPPAAKPTSADCIAPNRSQRVRCWEARDAFFKCLDANGVIDSMKYKDLATEKCGKEDIEFGKECVASWVDYFKKRRVMEYKKEQMLKGLAKEDAVKMDVPLPPPKG
ncbi:cytochrome oxidase c subunit VIb-domain-containing protein [Tirmania nivea]|nr:cytochrome oxidase c subunit VIb-domain-containing protein [Tirmania nivea]